MLYACVPTSGLDNDKYLARLWSVCKHKNTQYSNKDYSCPDQLDRTDSLIMSRLRAEVPKLSPFLEMIKKRSYLPLRIVLQL
ncbi:hypothetical protein BgiMline_027347 [Biomphalaria glabrata]|nr:hypothetical protein BgiMline_025145 [Biomphalaria glabrata]